MHSRELCLAEALVEQLEHRRLAALEHDAEDRAHAHLCEQGPAQRNAELCLRQLGDPSFHVMETTITNQRLEFGPVAPVAKLRGQDRGKRLNALAAHY